MEHTPNKPHGELEVTGVSRSGRVCKKSSKLMDFQSPDDINDAKQKKTAKGKGTGIASGNIQQSTPVGVSSGSSGLGYLIDAIKSEHGADMLSGDSDFPSESGGDTNDSDDDDAIDIEDMEGGSDDEERSDTDLLVEMPPKQSLYMSEKSARYKKVLKDGKVVMGKAQRKDKGVRRITAYMLWAKEARQQLMGNPEMDFASMSRRLGELWNNVPTNTKHNWKRRARHIAKKFKENSEKALETPYVKRYLHLDKIQSQAPAKAAASSTTTTPVRAKKAQPKATVAAAESKMSSAAVVHHSPESPTKGGAHLKLPGYQPTDVAAHLKLLGDSLTIIGERLKEHEGQIAVSGSLSVLLDSLLCSLGPLMCLTMHIPGIHTEGDRLKELCQDTLDNIAYVMPGL
ncbi:HMG box-containing protein 4 [Uranotaenia lowii]|uniref:HMG box-containing protein 4 n=1 Tax=Uranotaenia lowii TaxID=190385 RepID=UPI00247A248A|nr:HMG box-containing protein 4 [Uranotaenia lowii]